MNEATGLNRRLRDLGVPAENREDIDLIIKFFQMVGAHESEELTYKLDCFDLMVIQTAVCSLVHYPGYEKVDARHKQPVERFRGFCRRSWMARGLTSAEAQRMDYLLAKEPRCEKKE